MTWHQAMGLKRHVLRPSYIGTESAQTQLLLCSNSKVHNDRQRELSEKLEEVSSSLGNKEALPPLGSQFGILRTLHFFASILIVLSSGIFCS